MSDQTKTTNVKKTTKDASANSLITQGEDVHDMVVIACIMVVMVILVCDDVHDGGEDVYGDDDNDGTRSFLLGLSVPILTTAAAPPTNTPPPEPTMVPTYAQVVSKRFITPTATDPGTITDPTCTVITIDPTPAIKIEPPPTTAESRTIIIDGPTTPTRNVITIDPITIEVDLTSVNNPIDVGTDNGGGGSNVVCPSPTK